DVARSDTAGDRGKKTSMEFPQILLARFEHLIGMAAQELAAEHEFVEMKSQAALDGHDSIRCAQMPVHLGAGSGDDECQHFISRDEVFDQSCLAGQHLLNILDCGCRNLLQ